MRFYKIQVKGEDNIYMQKAESPEHAIDLFMHLQKLPVEYRSKITAELDHEHVVQW